MLNNEDDLYTVLIEDDGLGMSGPDEPMTGEHAGLAIGKIRLHREVGLREIDRVFVVGRHESGHGNRGKGHVRTT